MIVIINNLKRIFRNKIQLLFILLFPLAFMSIGFLQGDMTIKVAVVDEDQTNLTALLIHNLESRATVTSIKEQEIEDSLFSLSQDYIIKIEQGFTKGVITGEDARISGYSVKESNMSLPISTYINQWVGNLKRIAQATHYDEASFYKGLDFYHNDGFQLELQLVGALDWQKSRAVLGYFVIALLYTSLITALVIISNKNNHTFYRSMMAPISLKNYMFQNIVSFLLIAVLQIVLVLGLLRYGLNLYLGANLLSLFILFLTFALVSVSLGVLISSFSKMIPHAIIIGICIIPPLAMLGGAYWPNEIAPDIIKTIAQFVPVTWMMEGIKKLLNDEPFSAIGYELIVLILFATVFFLLGTFRRADISK